MSMHLILEHLFLVLSANILSILLGLPLGILAYLYPNARSIILRIVDLLQTIPSLALLGMIMVFIGPGKLTVIIGITLYSLLPIVRNTTLGLEGVDPGVKEAARGMGMGRLYRTLMVEFPLAFPTVFTGIRIAVVNAIGTGVFAAFVGGGGLGSVITRGIRIQDMGMILAGTGALMVIAIVMDLLMGRFEVMMQKRRMGKKLWIPVAAVLLAFILLLPYGMRSDSGNTLRLYDGNYSEPQLVHHMVKMLVEDQTDLEVTIQDEMTQVNNFKALVGKDHTCDLMLSYDGTLLTTFLHLDPSDVPEGQSIYDYAGKIGAEKHDLRMLKELGFNNTYSVAVPQDVADRYGLEKVSDLIPVAKELVFGAEHDFFTMEGSMKYGPFTDFYGLHFQDTSPVDVTLKYAAIENGGFDVTVVYATDGLNRKANLKVLEDDLHFFPDYNGVFLVRNDTFERFKETAPQLEDILNELAGQISNDDMVEMTYQVDVEGRSVDEVARAFLVERGLLLA